MITREDKILWLILIAIGWLAWKIAESKSRKNKNRIKK